MCRRRSPVAFSNMKTWPARLVPREPTHHSMDSGIVACAVITALVAIFVVILRFYARWCLVKKVRPEDWCILASMFLAVATSINLGRRESFVSALQNTPSSRGS